MRVLKYVIDGQEWTINPTYGSRGNGPYYQGYTVIDGKRVQRYFGKTDPRTTAQCVKREYATPKRLDRHESQNQIATYGVTYNQICEMAEYHGLSLKATVAKLAAGCARDSTPCTVPACTMQGTITGA
jgi:hypothetical protein